MSEASAGRFVVELASVFDPAGLEEALGYLDKTKAKFLETGAGLGTSITASLLGSGLKDALADLANPNMVNLFDGAPLSAYGVRQRAQANRKNEQFDLIDEEDLRREEFFLSYAGRLYTSFFGEQKTLQADWDRSLDESYRIRDTNNRRMLTAMQRDWLNYSMTVKGGWLEAMATMEAKGSNWTQRWLSMISNAEGRAAQVIEDFCTKSSASFLKVEKLVVGIFNSILQAFLDMMAQIAAKTAILGIFKVLGLFSGDVLDTALGKVLGTRKTGGPIGQTGQYLLHAGEYVLPAEVVSAIKAERAPAPAAGTTAALQGGQSATVFNVAPTINIGANVSQPDARRISQEITEAVRKGVSWAVDQARVTYKAGKARSAETAL
ncbi:MAG: hypothetical protein PHW69_02650 [Elusimicrobiaceae bacterium]|nr:hypothetical protein [Elusimicrobiaceae bacterium]